MNQHTSISRFHEIRSINSAWQWDGTGVRHLHWIRELGWSSRYTLRNSCSQIWSRNLAHDNLISGYNSKAWKGKFRNQCQRSWWIIRFDCSEEWSVVSRYSLDWFTCLSGGQDLTDRVNLLLEIPNREGSIVLGKLKGRNTLWMPQTYGSHLSLRREVMSEQVFVVCLQQRADTPSFLPNNQVLIRKAASSSPAWECQYSDWS